jgi:drug/metabolite transporter (DMT)-like permease
MELWSRLYKYRWGLFAALAFGLYSPVGKVLLERLSPFLLASLTYLGAGIGMLALGLLRRRAEAEEKEAGLSRKDLPYLIMMVVLDACAPILLFVGLISTSAATVSLLTNFEIVATTVIAMAIFKEAVGKRLWIAVVFITVGGIVLSVEDWDGLVLSPGALCVLGAALLWGLENNCTRMTSLSDPVQTTVIKGIGSGLTALALALIFEKIRFDPAFAALALFLGFVTVGLSVWFYILSQRDLGAARTSSVYALAPFIGVTISFLALHERPAPSFYVALALMAIGLFLSASECHVHFHTHKCQDHDHLHTHDDMHHVHHTGDCPKKHTHRHAHDENPHSHEHLPDMHHTHGHDDKGGQK